MPRLLSLSENPSPPGNLSQAEALTLLDRSEEIGLVHTVSNVMKGIGYVCNCCGCCCGILRGINDWGIENSVAHANDYAVIDPETCSACGSCVDRCQVHAISQQDVMSHIDTVHRSTSRAPTAPPSHADAPTPE